MIKLNSTASASADPVSAVLVTALYDPDPSGGLVGELEPTAAELAAIDAERPLIEAEMDLVGAEIRVLTAEPHPTELDWRALRRAERAVAREAKAWSARTGRVAALGRAA